MTEVDQRPEIGDELWIDIPTGWIELVAHGDDEEAARWFDRLLAKTPDLFDEAGIEILRASYNDVRRQIPRSAVDAAGVLVTTLENDEVTLWQYTVTLIAGPPSGDVNIMAVVERFMDSPEGRKPLTDKDDIVENFQLPDGRDGVAIHTTTHVQDDSRLKANVPGTDAERLGVVYAAVRLNRAKTATADRIAVVVGISPNVEQRLPMSLIAAQLTLSARLRDSDAPAPPGPVDVDNTGFRRDEAEQSEATAGTSPNADSS